MKAMRRALFCSTFVAMISTACSAILGIDFPPLLASGDDGGEAGDDAGDAAGEATTCAFTEPLPCHEGCLHAFCEDFDDAGALFPRWTAPPGFINPFALGDASVVLAEAGASSTGRLSVVLHGDSKPTAGLLLHRLPADVVGDPTHVDGIRIAFDARVEASDLAEAGGPNDAGTALLAFLGSGADKVSGPGLALGERDIFLFASTDILRGGSTELSGQRVTEGFGVSTFVNVPARLSLFAGSPARARALGYRPCPDVPLVFAASWGLALTCVAAPAAFSFASLPVDPTIAVGSILRGPGAVVLGYDNVFVDVFVSQ